MANTSDPSTRAAGHIIVSLINMPPVFYAAITGQVTHPIRVWFVVSASLWTFAQLVIAGRNKQL